MHTILTDILAAQPSFPQMMIGKIGSAIFLMEMWIGMIIYAQCIYIVSHNFDNYSRRSAHLKWASSCSPPTSLELMMIVN